MSNLHKWKVYGKEHMNAVKEYISLMFDKEGYGNYKRMLQIQSDIGIKRC